MAHRQGSISGNNGGGNQNAHLERLFQQQNNNYIRQQQQQLQSIRHQTPISDRQQQQLLAHHIPIPSHLDQVDQNQRLDPHLRASPGRLNSNANKLCPYPQQPELWRNPIPSHFPQQTVRHPVTGFSLPPIEEHSFREQRGRDEEIRRTREREEEIRRARERDEEIRRTRERDEEIRRARERDEDARRAAQEQVMKHFEDSFRYAQQKTSAQTRYTQSSQPPQIVTKLEEVNSRMQGMMGGPRVPSPQSKVGYHHNMAYGPGQAPPYTDLSSSNKLGGKIAASPPSINRDGEFRGYYPPPQQHLPVPRPRDPVQTSIVTREAGKYPNSNMQGGPKGNFPAFGPPPPVSRVKVSSPAPQQIYGKPSIQGSNSPSSARCYAPLSLTSKGSTRPTPTPPLPSNLPKHEVRSADLATYYMYSVVPSSPPFSQAPMQTPRFSPKSEYQTQPLDLGGKRKMEPKSLDLEVKKGREEDSAFLRGKSLEVGTQKPSIGVEGFPRVSERNMHPILNLVKGEVGMPQTQTKVPHSYSPIPPTLPAINGKEMVPAPASVGKKPKVLVVEIQRDGQRTPPSGQAQLVATPPPPPNGVGTSDSSSLNSKPSTISTSCASPNLIIHKGRKVFLQRHSGQDAVVATEVPKVGPPLNNGTTRIVESCPPITESAQSHYEEGSTDGWPQTGGSKIRRKIEKNAGGSNGHESVRRRRPSSSDDSEEDAKSPPKRPRPKGKRKILQKPKNSGSENSHSESEKESHTSDCNSKDNEQASSNNNCNPLTPVKKRGRKPRTDSGGSPTKVNKRSNPFKRPSIHVLRKTGESFLQDGSCTEVAAKLGKCRECRLNGTKTKHHADIFCRFYAFRKLRYTKNGSLAIAGFSDPTHDPTEEDLNLWLPSKEITPKSLDIELAKFLIDELGDQFCELIQQEKEAININMSESQDFVAWKRVVQGVREMCDVCDTTLFNYHWACKKCGFVVCISCYRGRKEGIIKNKGKTEKERDEFQWLFCQSNRQAHEMENLMLTQAIAGEALTSLGDLLHKMRFAWKIPQDCGCDNLKRLMKGRDYQSDNNVGDLEQQATKDEFGEDEETLSELAGKLADGSGNKEKDSQVDKAEGQSARPEHELKYYIRRAGFMIRRRKEPPPAVLANALTKTQLKHPRVPHSWLTYGKLLRLHDPGQCDNQDLFREVWVRGQPVIVSHVADKLNKQLWSPEAFLKDFSELKNDLVNCMTGRILANQPMKKFWEGFECVGKRLKDEKGNPMLLKVKDWPPGEDFAESLPSRFLDLMNCLPLKEYTHRTGRLNLASRLPPNFARPYLGPKMYIAYGSGLHLDKGTTNIHLDTSDAVNLMVYVGVPKDVDNVEDKKAVFAAIEESDVDGPTVDRVRDGELPGALWHIYNSKDADKIRDLLNKVAVERGVKLEPEHDPIHDQSWYLDKPLRDRLVREYDIVGFPLVQFEGDAVFIPAGAPHQVRNLHNCIKIAEDFVSPENVSYCFQLTEEFRDLKEAHQNHEDKLQIKNIIYHSVKDSVSVLYQNMNERQRKSVEGLAEPE